ncbi:class I SAM-dependent methyltransferase [Flavobacterium microcysteis]|uniref:class I SAM-dependent methyltransferase n=1 Tax=Flavobacterium microcysteis TaxID=2596891 RepID=UPI0018F562EC|nr:class I SAM-dependent methyltransferase [Flavobacterium microcysteis]
MIEEIKTYYDELASTYDQNRFGNSYGTYIDIQERAYLKKNLPPINSNNILDLGCGTGRFLDYASHGVDISPKMIEIAKGKFPDKNINLGSVSEIPHPNAFFDILFSFHVLMHLDKPAVTDFLSESHQKLKENGRLIFDFPSQKRRRLFNYKNKGWHGANALSIKDIENLIKSDWKIKQYQGILFFPIHRFPSTMRPLLQKIDTLFCKTFLKEYSSYLVIELEKAQR